MATEKVIAKVWSSSGALVLEEDVTGYSKEVLTKWRADLESRGHRVCLKRYVDGKEILEREGDGLHTNMCK